MAASAGSVTVDIDGNSAGLTKAVNESQAKLKQFGRQARSTVNSMGKIGGAAAGAGAALSAHIVTNAAESADELKNLAAQARTTPNELQKMAFASKQFGVSQKDLADILKDTQDRVGDFTATGAGPMADFFEKIAPQVGVTAKQFQKLSGPESLQLFVDSLEKANVSQSEMTFYMEALSSESTKLLPLLRDGGKAMAEQKREAERLNVALSDMQVEKLNQLSDTMSRGKDVASGMAKEFSAKLAPTIKAVQQYMQEVIKGAGGMGTVTTKAADAMASAIGFVGDTIRGIQVSIKLVKLAVNGAALALVQGWTMAGKVIADIVEGAEDKANALIGALNNIPDVNIPKIDIPTEGVVEGLEGTRDQLVRKVEGIKSDLHDLMMKKMPSEVLDNMTEEAKKAMEKTANKAINEMNTVNNNSGGPDGNGGGPGSGSGEGEGEDKKKTAAERVAAQNKKRREQIRKGYEKEFLMKQKFKQRQLSLDKMYKEKELLTEKQYNQAKFKTMKKYTEDQVGVKSSGYKAMNEVVAKNMGAEEASVANSMGSIVNSTAKHSKKAFQIQKAAGIANAIVSTYQGAAKALEMGPVAGPPAAAAITAAGFAKVASIKQQSFSGGGSGSGGGGAGGGGAGGGGVSTNASGGGQRGGDGEDSRRMYLHGVERDKDYDGHQIIDAIKTARDEGAVLDIGDS